MNGIVLSEKQLQDKGMLIQELGATGAQAELLVMAVEEVILRHVALTDMVQVLNAVSSKK